jgi:hypothetical protein
MPPIYPILIFLLSPTFYFWHIWYTHTLANNNNKKSLLLLHVIGCVS